MFTSSNKEQKATLKEAGSARKIKSSQSKDTSWKTDKSASGRPHKSK